MKLVVSNSGVPRAIGAQTIKRSDGPIRLRTEATAEGWVVMAENAGPVQPLRIQHLGRTRPLPPVLDGIAFAALPLALRAHRTLHVEGALTRLALRNLREMAEAWASWDRDSFTAVDVTCDRVQDNDRTPHGPVLAAWSGDLRSTFAVADGEASMSEAGYQVGAALHVLGLGRLDPAPDVADAFRAYGIERLEVSTNALEAGYVDPVIGCTPIVAAALHLVGDGLHGTAIHAHSAPMRAQLIRPRLRPTLGDVYSGDRLSILAVGGTASLPVMAAHVAARPDLQSLLLRCRETGMAAPRCGHCRDCRLLDLGLTGAGISLDGPRMPTSSFAITDSELEAEAILALQDWSGPRLQRMQLASRLTLRAMQRARHDHAVWQQIREGQAAPWPR